MEFSRYEKEVLKYFFTSSDESDTIYAARPILNTVIISSLMGRASRTSKTFREIFLEMWEESTDYAGSSILNLKNNDSECIQYMTNKAEKFIYKWNVHNSLRDAPVITIFCDSLTILQTKVWEYEPVAAYQEKSTRYRPFDASNILIPDVSPDIQVSIRSHLLNLVTLYKDLMEATGKRDVARYVLPVGSLTAMACMAPLRSWERIVGRMLGYPTRESNIIGNNIKDHIRKIIPSFDHSIMPKYDYLVDCSQNIVHSSEDQKVEILRMEDVLKIKGLIDIGAHRDLQRHRSVIQGHHDYRAIYGYDQFMYSYMSLDYNLVNRYKEAMTKSTALFLQCELLLPKEVIGEAQFLTLLGHMTPFYFITNRERWNYIYNLRTGNPSQFSTTSETVHFSYANWCHEVQKKLDRI